MNIIKKVSQKIKPDTAARFLFGFAMSAVGSNFGIALVGSGIGAAIILMVVYDLLVYDRITRYAEILVACGGLAFGLIFMVYDAFNLTQNLL